MRCKTNSCACITSACSPLMSTVRSVEEGEQDKQRVEVTKARYRDICNSKKKDEMEEFQ
jgi:hypothetical protein